MAFPTSADTFTMPPHLILQGLRPETHLTALRRLLQHPGTQQATISVAYLNSAGVNLIADVLAAPATPTRVFAGIRNPITSAQGLRRLLTSGVELYAVDTGAAGVTYHPKLYLASSATDAQLVVGSANLTVGGLNNNIEASLHVTLDFQNSSDLRLYQSVDRLFSGLPTALPHNVIPITTPDAITNLLNAGRLADETSSRPTRAAADSSDDVPRIPLAVEPLHRPLTPAHPPAPALRPSTAPSPLPSVATDLAPHLWETVWTSGDLTERDLNIPTGPTTNVTGSINLDKGLLPPSTDHRHYFRAVVFSALSWRSAASGIEEAAAQFDLIVKGVSRGTFQLKLSHSTSTTSRSYLQRNAMTRLRWGRARRFVARRALLERSLTLFRHRSDPTAFLIQID